MGTKVYCDNDHKIGNNVNKLSRNILPLIKWHVERKGIKNEVLEAQEFDNDKIRMMEVNIFKFVIIENSLRK